MSRASEKTGADPPLVSVVVPTCNRREILERCLEALARQTHPNYEVIVVDDCSTDDTPRILREFGARRPDLNFRWLRNTAHSGANPSRNRGIRESNGEFVAFVDDDSIAEDDWLERLMRGFTSERVAAVTGMVNSPPPTNLYELTLKGTQRVHGSGSASRLVGCNMCVRRAHLLRYMLDEDRASPAVDANGTPDVTVSGRGDEEGLFLLLRASRYEQKVVPDAVVLHEHGYTRRSFFKQAYRGGGAAARLVYKYRLPHRLDMVPFMLAYLTCPLVLIDRWLAVIPLFFFAGALAAITYNDLFRKRKTIGETVRSFPVLLAHYHVRLFAYVTELVRLYFGKHDIKRVRLSAPPRICSKKPES